MNPIDLIQEKKENRAHLASDLEEFVRAYVNHVIPDYQMAAWLMAVCLNGMTQAETSALTRAMATSGATLDLGSHFLHSADKHSTGGVGDKTTLVAVPLAAACGVKVAKMSGRGLGHTGGTIDKLESIPGLRTTLGTAEFLAQLAETGLVIAGQTANLAPADKMMYALRDVTATVASEPLIAASIMSKKIAAGAKHIVLDVKCGQGAFMKTVEEAVRLAQTMAEIGERLGRQVVAYVTNMNRPLGRAVGNALEVAEAVATLKGEGPADLLAVGVTLATEMVSLAFAKPLPNARSEVNEALASGAALARLRAMIVRQGGAWDDLAQAPRLPKAPVTLPLYAPTEGYLTGIDALAIGRLVMSLGAGRTRKEDEIDPRTGVVMGVALGERVAVGDTIAHVHARSEAEAQAALHHLADALSWSPVPPRPTPLIYARVTATHIEYDND